jgi:type II secretory pathway pseudopilin PulG
MTPSFKKGMSIVEIIVAAAIIAVSVIGIVAAIQVYLKVVYQNTRETQAVLLLDETAEALQYMRDDGFGAHIESKTLGDTYTIYWDGSGYELSASTITLPYGMTRSVVFSSIKRDGNDQISSSGSTDENTLKAVITISWPYKEEMKILSSEMLIHDMYEN